MTKREELAIRQQQIKARLAKAFAGPEEPVAKPEPIKRTPKPTPRPVPKSEPEPVQAKVSHNKGKSLRVDPITDLKKIEAIKWLLRDKPRDLALFTVGINTNLRASDLSRITVGQVRNLKPMDEICLKEKKTGKPRRISMNSACVRAINAYLNTVNLSDDTLIFGMSIRHMGRIVKGWCEAANCKGSFASHTLRKTFARMQFSHFGVQLPVLCQIMNHSNERMTLGYISIQPAELKAVYANEL